MVVSPQSFGWLANSHSRLRSVSLLGVFDAAVLAQLEGFSQNTDYFRWIEFHKSNPRNHRAFETAM